MSFPAHSSYAESDVSWLGPLPSHWSCKPIKAIASCNDDVLGEATPANYEIEYVEISDVEAGSGVKGSTSYAFGAAPSRARRRVRHGDVIVSTVRTYLRAIASVREPPDNLIASTGFAVIRPLNHPLIFQAKSNAWVKVVHSVISLENRSTSGRSRVSGMLGMSS
jgi:type I restriction enzyme S subunit